MAKKKDIIKDEVVEEVVEAVTEAVSPKIVKIAPLTISFQTEDLNTLRDKVNELVNKVNENSQ